MSQELPATEPPVESLYGKLDFHSARDDRPYVLIDMAATIDGKTVTGDRSDDVLDLGSKLDHRTLRALEAQVDAVLIGAGTLRSNPRQWSPLSKLRFVVTSSGDLPLDSAFFREGEAYVIHPGLESPLFVAAGNALPSGSRSSLDLPGVLRSMRKNLNVGSLLVEGGSEINSLFLAKDLVDELFLTIAPKVKLGRMTPTLAGGEALERGSLLSFSLVEHRAVGDELFLRYRRCPGP